MAAAKVREADKAHEIAQAFINGLSKEEQFKKHNLLFAYMFTTKSSDKAFKLFKDQSVRANEVLGKKLAAERKVNSVLYAEEVKPYIKYGSTDWAGFEKSIKGKHGNLFQQYYYTERLRNAFHNKLHEEFGKFYALYYKSNEDTYGAFNINNVSWRIFEQISDSKIIEIAVATMKNYIDQSDKDNPASMDTYANLLYKSGRIAEAIAMQEKIVQLSEEKAAKGNHSPNPVFKETLAKMKAGVKTWVSKVEKLTPKAGEAAPDFIQADSLGKKVTLSSYKGKYVLLDFWASWCGPCRVESPNLLKAYDKYKNKNFTIIGVTRDEEKDKGKWLKAITDDGMTWLQLSDFDQSAAMLYNAVSLPSNFLIDPTGKIIATNLRGDGLERVLKEVFK
ncbi:peroxiredoxin family protein [Pedobacter heparinus]|uniref:peroxiredoxin family protein n=1 Tax=Pedobacter heparinus TaxID=984 RepID=UPI00292FA723|nr:redoxin domain-containing protein [Pedobacter heparinus]